MSLMYPVFVSSEWQPKPISHVITLQKALTLVCFRCLREVAEGSSVDLPEPERNRDLEMALLLDDEMIARGETK